LVPDAALLVCWAKDQLVPLGWRDDFVADEDCAPDDYICNKASTVVEDFFEVEIVATSFPWSLARLAVLHASEPHVSDSEVFPDQAHELDATHNDIPPTFFVFESTVYEESGVYNRDLALATLAPVEATLTGCVPVAVESLACYGFDLLHPMHRSTCAWANTDSNYCSVWHSHGLLLFFFLERFGSIKYYLFKGKKQGNRDIAKKLK
jgi:hypothetical protein